MIIDLITLLILISFIKSLFGSQKEFKTQRIIAIEKGVPPVEFTTFNIAITIYWVPILVYYLLRFQALYSVWFPFLAILCYLPGILLADSIGTKLECGYDFQRKAAKKIKEAEYLGWIMLAFCEIFWIVSYMFLR